MPVLLCPIQFFNFYFRKKTPSKSSILERASQKNSTHTTLLIDLTSHSIFAIKD